MCAFGILAENPVSVAAEQRETARTGIEVTASGSVETVFSWQRDVCDRADVPDAPARAFRDAAGNVHLYAANHHNRGVVGRDLHSVRRAGCGVTFRGAEAADPASYDDRAWLAGFWTEDGQTVYALVHNEYLGNKHGACRSSRSIDCWMNTIVLAVSNDGGLTFRETLKKGRGFVPGPGRISRSVGGSDATAGQLFAGGIRREEKADAAGPFFSRDGRGGAVGAAD